MRIEQTIQRSGNHLILTIIEQPSGRRLAERMWENAAQYIHDEADGVLTIKVPISSELEVKPKVWEQA